MSRVPHARAREVDEDAGGLKQCGACRAWKPLDDFTRDASKKDGRHTHCRECKNARRNARKHADLAAARQKRRDWYHSHLEYARQAQRRFRARHRERLQAEDRERWHRNREENLRKRKEYYARTAGKRRAWQRRYYRATRDLRRERHREWRARNREHVRAYRRAHYWADPERARERERASRRRNLPAARHRSRARYWKNREQELQRGRRREGTRVYNRPGRFSMDAQGIRSDGKMGRAASERIADRKAVDPAQALLTRGAQTEVLRWMAEALSEEERNVLEAFADNGFDAEAAAALLGGPAGTVTEILADIRVRALREIGDAAGLF